ncbi:MAG TPA: hypothetical protein VK081_13970 [Planctomycetota bacterium]|nr:hypothetical protein [Planctomycetota bacterium]
MGDSEAMGDEAMSDPRARPPFPLRTCLHVALGFVGAAAAFHLWPHDPCAVLDPVTGVEDPLGMHEELRRPKEPGEIRVLFIGASLTFGYPYGLQASYATLLEVGLRAVFPDRRLVIKPIAKPAIDSTRVAEMVVGVLPAQPDAVFADFGGNEIGARIFLGRNLLPDDWLGRLADHGTRARGAFLALATRDRAKDAFAGEDVLQTILGRLLDARPARPLVGGLPVSARDRDLLAERTRQSMRRMAAATRAAGVPLVFLVSPYDLAGSWPRGMVEQVPAIDAAVLAHQRGTPVSPETAEALAAAHPDRADVQFLLGKVLLARGEQERARAAFERARDLDPAPLHTIGEVARAMAEEGRALGLDVLHPDAATCREGSDIPDPTCYLDPAHWNLEGASLGAAFFARALAGRGIVPPLPPGWRDVFDRAVRDYLDRTVPEARRAWCKAEMERATGAYHMLFGNVRDAVLPLADGVQWFTGLLEGPDTTMWNDWATRLLFCAAAVADRVGELTAGTHDAQVARMTALVHALWRAGKAGKARAFVERILDGESFVELAR